MAQPVTSPGDYTAFVSYASEDREKAEEICASLERRGLPCWIAPRNVRAGHEYADEIILGIERSAAMVLVLSEAANASAFVSREVERAVAKEKPVFPVRIEEVMPTSGLELLVSADHWTDVWSGRWDGHMDRLARDLSDRIRGTDSRKAPGRRALAGNRSSGVFAVIALLVIGAGLAMWFWSGQGLPVEALPVPEAQRQRVEPPLVAGVEAPSPVAPAVTPAPASSRPADVTAATSAPPAVVTKELNALRDVYDDLALRGGVVDDTLNQLWEEMKPASPRLDMVTHQRSLKTGLTRSRDALAKTDAAAARKYLDAARVDLEVLERFLNR